jgi:hypothetical protein
MLRKRKFEEEEKTSVKIEVPHIHGIMKSKEDIYKFLSEQLQLFLPSLRAIDVSKNH